MTEMPSVTPLAEEAAPGATQFDARAAKSKDNDSLYKAARARLPEACPGQVPQHQMGGHDRDARHLLRPAVDQAGPRPGPARSGLPARFRPSAALFLLARNLGAGILLRHRHSGALGARAVPRHRARGPGLVRLRLPADGLDRPHDPGRALLAGRPQRAHQARQGALVVQQGSGAWPARISLGCSSPFRPAAPSSSISATRRRLPPSSGTAPRRPRLHLHRHHHRLHLSLSAGSPASRSAPICAPGRASRAPCSTAIRCSSPIAASGASRAAPTRRARAGKAAAIASIAGNAWPPAPRASTSATARSSNASGARCASTPATRSWTRSAGPRKLIAYDSFRNLKAESHGDRVPFRLIRPRTMLYTAVFALVAAVMLFGLTHKSVLDVNVVPDRNPLFVQVSGGGIRNGYTVRILNKKHGVAQIRDRRHGAEGRRASPTSASRPASPRSRSNPTTSAR